MSDDQAWFDEHARKGLQAAVAVLTARMHSLDGMSSIEEFVDALRAELEDFDAVDLLEAMSTLAAGFCRVIGAVTRKDPYLVPQSTAQALIEGSLP